MAQVRIILISGLFFFLALAVGIAFVFLIEQHRAESDQRALLQVASSRARLLQAQLNHSLSTTFALASLVRQFKGVEDFETLAADMVESYGGISGLALAPNGVVSQVYPRVGNEALLDTDLLKDPAWQAGAKKAVESHSLIVSGPTDLPETEDGIIGYLPIFLPDDRGQERFWGFSLVMLPLDGLIGAHTLAGMDEQAFSFGLYAGDDEAFQAPLLTNRRSLDVDRAVRVPVDVPGGHWVLAIAGAGGPDHVSLLLEMALVLLISGLTAFVAYELVRQPLVLKQQVAAQTRALWQTNRRLEKEMEERKQTARGYRDLFENANDCIYTLDRHGCFTSINRRVEALTGFAKTELLGKPYASIVAPQERTKARHTFVANLKGALQTFELTLLTKTGEPLVVEINSRPIRQGEEIIGVQGIARDITERKALETMKDEFVATVSHELRTPLTSIKGYAELLLLEEQANLGEKQRSFLNVLLRNARRLNALINDLLDVAKLDAGHILIEPRRFDLNCAIQAMVEMFQVQADEKGLYLRVHTADGLWVKGDRQRLEQVFANLLSNALKYTSEGGVTIEGSVAKGRVTVSFCDTGIGIEQADLEHLFSKFYRARNDHTRRVKGTGLGLAISRRIIDQHHGRIDVKSQPGTGSVFRVILPLAKSDEHIEKTIPSAKTL